MGSGTVVASVKRNQVFAGIRTGFPQHSLVPTSIKQGQRACGRQTALDLSHGTAVCQLWPGASLSLPVSEVRVLSLLWSADSNARLHGCSCGLDGTLDVKHLACRGACS